MESMLTSENVKNHFIVNPDWEAIYLKHFPNWKPENYTENARKLLKDNGYTIKTNRRSKNKTSMCYHIMDADLYNRDEFVIGMQGHDSQIVEQLIVSIICNYEIDFTKFK